MSGVFRFGGVAEGLDALSMSGPMLQEDERSILESDHAVPLQQIKDHQDHHSHGKRDREATHNLPVTWARLHGALPVLTAVAIETNSALSAPPSELAPSMMPKAISAAIKPYSMAVAPESSRRKLAINRIFAQASTADQGSMRHC